ncbi:hypothetical protein OOK41_14245 [Micromonospora sp. NBC_01655]|uniref:hypothetical protein n=1 Tax=Micromonospora sp. NBC_01655 TaxID=2975983 RepID=UPI002250B365|nr:hypothetical protein [Micromonospora sp. NBC_01655]MCX4471452.1 hypothetical protein [Micromonospora sp. NBC_01655]
MRYPRDRPVNIVDEYTREALATRAAHSFTADAAIAVLDEVSARRVGDRSTSGWTTAPT